MLIHPVAKTHPRLINALFLTGDAQGHRVIFQIRLLVRRAAMLRSIDDPSNSLCLVLTGSCINGGTKLRAMLGLRGRTHSFRQLTVGWTIHLRTICISNSDFSMRRKEPRDRWQFAPSPYTGTVFVAGQQ